MPATLGAWRLQISGTVIEDSFAEAFRLRYVRLIVTAYDDYWLNAAVAEFTGYGTSVIACDCEAGVEQYLPAESSPDGRPAAAILAFGFTAEVLAKAVARRAGQCLMTCPTTSVYDGLAAGETQVPLGQHLRFFGDGYQKSKQVAGVRYWRVPVMDGEFLVVDKLWVGKGVGGGNLILEGAELAGTLAAVRRAVAAIGPIAGAITPFPGGAARSGSKVGSRYKNLVASTADAFCPTLRGRVASQLDPLANVAYEIVIDGVDEHVVAAAMAAGARAAAGPGISTITAGNYGGKLGKFHFRLYEVLAEFER